MPSEPEESTAFSVVFIFPLHLHRACWYWGEKKQASDLCFIKPCKRCTLYGMTENRTLLAVHRTIFLQSLDRRGVDDPSIDTDTKEFLSFV